MIVNPDNVAEPLWNSAEPDSLNSELLGYSYILFMLQMKRLLIVFAVSIRQKARVFQSPVSIDSEITDKQ